MQTITYYMWLRSCNWPRWLAIKWSLSVNVLAPLDAWCDKYFKVYKEHQ